MATDLLPDILINIRHWYGFLWTGIRPQKYHSEIEKKRDMYTNQKDIEQGNVGHPLLSSGEC